jgi:hypothetical protein
VSLASVFRSIARRVGFGGPRRLQTPRAMLAPAPIVVFSQKALAFGLKQSMHVTAAAMADREPAAPSTMSTWGSSR